MRGRKDESWAFVQEFLTTEITKLTKMPFPLRGIGMFVWEERATLRALLREEEDFASRRRGDRREGDISHESSSCRLLREPSRALRKDRPRGMMMAALTFLPCKPFSSPSAEMEKLRELRALCGYKKSLKDALAHTEIGHGARSMRQTGKVFQDFSHHEAHRGHPSVRGSNGRSGLSPNQESSIVAWRRRRIVTVPAFSVSLILFCRPP